jgi:hypothetical protein
MELYEELKIVNIPLPDKLYSNTHKDYEWMKKTFFEWAKESNFDTTMGELTDVCRFTAKSYPFAKTKEILFNINLVMWM